MIRQLKAEHLEDSVAWLLDCANTGSIPIAKVLEKTAPPGALGRKVEIGTPSRRAVVLAMDSPPADTAAAFFVLPPALLDAMRASRALEAQGASISLPNVRQAQPQRLHVAPVRPAKRKKAAKVSKKRGAPKRNGKDAHPQEANANADKSVEKAGSPKRNKAIASPREEKANGAKKVRLVDLKPKQLFVCDCEFEGGVGGLALCVVVAPPDKNGDFKCYSYKSQYANVNPKWVTGKHYKPIGGERKEEPVNASNVMVLVPDLLRSKAFPKQVLAAIKTHPAYQRVGKKLAPDSNPDDDVPLGVLAGLSRSVSA